MLGAIPPLPQYVFTAWCLTKKEIVFPKYYSSFVVQIKLLLYINMLPLLPVHETAFIISPFVGIYLFILPFEIFRGFSDKVVLNTSAWLRDLRFSWQ